MPHQHLPLIPKSAHLVYDKTGGFEISAHPSGGCIGRKSPARPRVRERPRKNLCAPHVRIFRGREAVEVPDVGEKFCRCQEISCAADKNLTPPAPLSNTWRGGRMREGTRRRNMRSAPPLHNVERGWGCDPSSSLRFGGPQSHIFFTTNFQFVLQRLDFVVWRKILLHRKIP